MRQMGFPTDKMEGEVDIATIFKDLTITPLQRSRSEAATDGPSSLATELAPIAPEDPQSLKEKLPTEIWLEIYSHLLPAAKVLKLEVYDCIISDGIYLVPYCWPTVPRLPPVPKDLFIDKISVAELRKTHSVILGGIAMQATLFNKDTDVIFLSDKEVPFPINTRGLVKICKLKLPIRFLALHYHDKISSYSILQLARKSRTIEKIFLLHAKEFTPDSPGHNRVRSLEEDFRLYKELQKILLGLLGETKAEDFLIPEVKVVKDESEMLQLVSEIPRKGAENND